MSSCWVLEAHFRQYLPSSVPRFLPVLTRLHRHLKLPFLSQRFKSKPSFFTSMYQEGCLDVLEMNFKMHVFVKVSADGIHRWGQFKPGWLNDTGPTKRLKYTKSRNLGTVYIHRTEGESFLSPYPQKGATTFCRNAARFTWPCRAGAKGRITHSHPPLYLWSCRCASTGQI